MISTRENLLARPWQQKKYEYHKKKVLTATPAIDTKSPPHRPHVTVKLKKLQKEEERSRKIERDNLILLQKLNYIMTKHWQDNYLPPQPTFLRRIGMYRMSDSGVGLIEDLARNFDMQDETAEPLSAKPKCRKLKCLACSPMRLIERVQKPEERMPWAPVKKPPERGRSRSVPPKKRAEPLPTICEKPKSAIPLAKTELKPKTDPFFSEEKKNSLPIDARIKQPNIVLSRGALKLSINYPADTLVHLDPKRTQSKVCRCSSRTTSKTMS